MSNYDIIRAWKDEDYLESLSEEQRVLMPENPAGMIELSDEDMEVVVGGNFNDDMVIKNGDLVVIEVPGKAVLYLEGELTNGGYCFNFYQE